MSVGIKRIVMVGAVIGAVVLGVVASAGRIQASSRVGYGFIGNVSGFGTASAFISGGGSFDPSAASNNPAVAAGGFRCTGDVPGTPAVGKVSGCLEGEGVRWDTVQLLPSTNFKCSATDTVHTVSTDRDTVVLLADFYRAGDGNDESFSSVPMFVSANDERPDLPGVQNLWIASVGCGEATANFSR